MTIHKADIDDLARIEPMAREFFAASKFLWRFEMERFQTLWEHLIKTDAGVIFYLESEPGTPFAGAIGGVVYPDAYSSELVATEFFWFCRPGCRGKGLELYRRFEAWARNRHCSQIRMVHLMDSMPEKLSTVYRRLGYEPAETHYVKVLQ